MGVNITKRLKAEFSQNRQKGKIITKQIEAKPVNVFVNHKTKRI